MRVYRLYYSKATGFVLMFGDVIISKQRGEFNVESAAYICKVVANFKSGSQFCNAKDLDYNANWKAQVNVHKSSRWRVYKREAVFGV